MGILGAIAALFIAGKLIRATGDAVGRGIEENEKAKAYRRLRRFRGWRQRGDPSLSEILKALDPKEKKGGQIGDPGYSRILSREE